MLISGNINYINYTFLSVKIKNAQTLSKKIFLQPLSLVKKKYQLKKNIYFKVFYISTILFASVGNIFKEDSYEFPFLNIEIINNIEPII